MQSALKGIKIIDLTQAMAGPFATMLLGDLGADVIKIEPEHGDQTRSWAPPYMANISSYFMSTNRNKKSMAINLKSKEGKEIFEKLIAGSDILVENFRPGVMEKLGFSYDKVKSINKKIVYCSISGYGQTGPMKDYPGYDLTILAMSGLLGITGNPGESPVKFGVPIADITTALFATVSILAAIYNRDKTGDGQYIDLSMLDSNFLILTHQLMAYLSTGKNPEKLGSAHSSIAPYQAYKTLDSYIVITVGTEKLWKTFCQAIGPALADRNEFKTNVDRVSHRELLKQEIEKIIKNKTTSEIYELLIQNGIPCAPVNSVSDAVSNEQIKFREMIIDMAPEYGKISIPGTPFKLSESPGEIRFPPPYLGNANDEILGTLGFTPLQIDELYRNNIIFKKFNDK